MVGHLRHRRALDCCCFAGYHRPRLSILVNLCAAVSCSLQGRVGGAGEALVALPDLGATLLLMVLLVRIGRHGLPSKLAISSAKRLHYVYIYKTSILGYIAPLNPLNVNRKTMVNIIISNLNMRQIRDQIYKIEYTRKWERMKYRSQANSSGNCSKVENTKP